MPTRLVDILGQIEPDVIRIGGQLGCLKTPVLLIDHVCDDIKLNGETLFTRSAIDDNLHKIELSDRVTAILAPGWSETGSVTDVASLIWDVRDTVEA